MNNASTEPVFSKIDIELDAPNELIGQLVWTFAYDAWQSLISARLFYLIREDKILFITPNEPRFQLVFRRTNAKYLLLALNENSRLAKICRFVIAIT